MAAYLGFEFVDAAEVIRFNDDGTFNDVLTNELLSARLADMENAVIPDFNGAKEDGTVVTFSRGGSDVSGSLVALAVKPICTKTDRRIRISYCGSENC